MESRISATEVARRFSDVLNRVRYRGEEFVVERSGQAVCRIVPIGGSKRTVADLVHLLRNLPRPDDEFLEAVRSATRRQPKLPRSPWGR